MGLPLACTKFGPGFYMTLVVNKDIHFIILYRSTLFVMKTFQFVKNSYV